MVALTEGYEAENTGRKHKRGKSGRRKLAAATGAFIGDLLASSNNEASSGYCYRSSNRATFIDTNASSRNFDTRVNCWTEIGLLERAVGYQQWTEFGGESIPLLKMASRYRATLNLLRIAMEFGVTPSNSSEHFTETKDIHVPVSVWARSYTINGYTQKGEILRMKPSADLDKQTLIMDEINANPLVSATRTASCLSSAVCCDAVSFLL